MLDHLEAGEGSHFQPEIVDTFFDLGAERREPLREVDTDTVLGGE